VKPQPKHRRRGQDKPSRSAIDPIENTFGCSHLNQPPSSAFKKGDRVTVWQWHCVDPSTGYAEFKKRSDLMSQYVRFKNKRPQLHRQIFWATPSDRTGWEQRECYPGWSVYVAEIRGAIATLNSEHFPQSIEVPLEALRIASGSIEVDSIPSEFKTVSSGINPTAEKTTDSGGDRKPQLEVVQQSLLAG
jgi:hypothetical protein